MVCSCANMERMLKLRAGHGLDRVWYIPGTDRRPRYEEQVAAQNQSCTVLRWMGVVGQSIGIEWKLLEATNFLPWAVIGGVQQGWLEHYIALHCIVQCATGLTRVLHYIALHSVQQGWLDYCVALHCALCNRVDLSNWALHCIEQCATGLTWVWPYHQLAAQPFISWEVQAINPTKVDSRMRKEVCAREINPKWWDGSGTPWVLVRFLYRSWILKGLTCDIPEQLSDVLKFFWAAAAVSWAASE